MICSPLSIGSLKSLAPVLPAPMAGYSDRTSREISREMGCDLVFTEMISAEGMRRLERKTVGMVDTDGEAPPVSVQIFGKDPAALAGAARVLQDRGASAIDINAGCPAKKVTNGGSGSGLLQDMPLLTGIVSQTRRAISIPLTLKFRLGWDLEHLVYMEVARMAEGEGVDAIILHPRTRQQGFGGAADWRRIAEVKQAVSIPVIGNGDVWTGADARRMVRETGCDGVMIGRGWMGNPWILRAALQALTTDAADAECDRPITLEERLAMLVNHARLMARRKGEARAAKEIRKFAHGYLKGVRNSKPLRAVLMRCATIGEIEEAIAAGRSYLEAAEHLTQNAEEIERHGKYMEDEDDDTSAEAKAGV
ncbi:MAG: tRNA dihydrouridine synthase DusB [Candidatus Sumerlaeota bacterium]|nr:tRNA dihydrouridine synthase DusB [Candidatus Sumerlaeota bacterium]